MNKLVVTYNDLLNMKSIGKISFIIVLLFSTSLAFGQCETYLQKAETLFAQKKYEDAKRQYSNYKECKPNATGIDEKISECDRLIQSSTSIPANTLNAVGSVTEKKIYYNENWQGCSQYQAKYYRIVKFDASGKPVGKVLDYYITGELQSEIDGAIYIDEINDRNSKFIGHTVGYYINGVKSHEAQRDNDGKVLWTKRYKEDGTLIVPRTKPAIGIGSFSGYKSDQVKNNVTSAFVGDGRFIVTQVQNSGYGNNQQNSSDVDYIISGTSECIQSERTQYLNLPATKYTNAMSTPYTTPEVVNVAITFTNAKTGEIVANTTYNLNQLNRVSGDIFPVKFTINNVNGGTIGIVNLTGGTYFIGDVFNVYEENSNGGKSYLGKLKIGKTNNECKITDGKKEINNRFKAGAKLVVEK